MTASRGPNSPVDQPILHTPVTPVVSPTLMPCVVTPQLSPLSIPPLEPKTPTPQSESKAEVKKSNRKEETEQTRLKPHELPPEYKIEQLKGRGAYGLIYKALNTNTHQPVAVKKITHIFDTEDSAKSFLRETEILKMLAGHPNIIGLERTVLPFADELPIAIKLPEVADLPELPRASEIPKVPEVSEEAKPAEETFDDASLLMEFMETDLHSRIYSEEFLEDIEIESLLYQLLCAVSYTHSAKVIHRDITPSNILMSKDNKLRLADYGMARLLEVPQSVFVQMIDRKEGFIPPAPKLTRHLTQHVVTRWYRSPEVILLSAKYGLPSDMWSVACVFYELLMMLKRSGLKPRDRWPLFPGKTCFPFSYNEDTHQDFATYQDKNDQLQLIFDLIGTPHEEDIACIDNASARAFITTKLQERPAQDFESRFPWITPAARDLLKKLLVFNPANRMSAASALAHPYFDRVRNPIHKLTFPLAKPEAKSQNATSSTKEFCLYEIKLEKEATLLLQENANMAQALSASSSPAAETEKQMNEYKKRRLEQREENYQHVRRIIVKSAKSYVSPFHGMMPKSELGSDLAPVVSPSSSSSASAFPSLPTGWPAMFSAVSETHSHGGNLLTAGHVEKRKSGALSDRPASEDSSKAVKISMPVSTSGGR